MSPGLRTALTRTRAEPAALSPLGAFVDALVQAFEDRRAGLKDSDLEAAPAERFFGELYEHERERLSGTLRLSDPHLSPATRERLLAEVDTFARRVLIPAFARISVAFTLRERNDFFALRGAARGAERAVFLVGGILLGVLLVRAPFIPLWSKHWIWLFGLGGLFGPELRRYWAWRQYGRALNELVASSDRELERLRTAYLEGDTAEEGER